MKRFCKAPRQLGRLLEDEDANTDPSCSAHTPWIPHSLGSLKRRRIFCRNYKAGFPVWWKNLDCLVRHSHSGSLMWRKGHSSGSLYECSCVHVSRSCFLMNDLLRLLQGQKQRHSFYYSSKFCQTFVSEYEAKMFQEMSCCVYGNGRCLTDHRCNPGIKWWYIHFKLTPRCDANYTGNFHLCGLYGLFARTSCILCQASQRSSWNITSRYGCPKLLADYLRKTRGGKGEKSDNSVRHCVCNCWGVQILSCGNITKFLTPMNTEGQIGGTDANRARENYWRLLLSSCAV